MGLKILLIHTFYQLKGGEDTVFEQEYNLLNKENNVKILKFYNKSKWLGAWQFFLSIWNIFAAKKLKKMIKEFQPDIVHIHNLHFASGPIVVHVAKKKKIPIVLTLHNYRLICPSATLLSKGEVFIDSLNSTFPWKAIREKVYRNSAIQTFWLAFVNWFHNRIGTFHLINKYIVLTEFAKKTFLNSSLDIDLNRIVVKPNFVEHHKLEKHKREKHFLFVGRLSSEKGVSLLLNVFSNSSSDLFIAGEGPLKENVIKACNENLNIFYLGNLDKKQVLLAMQKCTALIFPSIWYEGMPMTILEAFASGTPVIATNLGAMASLIRHNFNGLHFEPNNKTSLKDALSYWKNLSLEEKETFQKNAHLSYENSYTPEINQKQLIKIYSDLLNKN